MTIEPDDFEDEEDTLDDAAGEIQLPVAAPPQRRRRVRTGPRPKVFARRELKVAVLANRSGDDAWIDEDRPRTRGDCRDGCRPCPYVACKHHLYLSVNPVNGSIAFSFPDLEPWELKESCALDVADRGGLTLEEVGQITNLTRERIRQLEASGLIKLRGTADALR